MTIEEKDFLRSQLESSYDFMIAFYKDRNAFDKAFNEHMKKGLALFNFDKEARTHAPQSSAK